MGLSETPAPGGGTFQFLDGFAVDLTRVVAGGVDPGGVLRVFGLEPDPGALAIEGETDALGRRFRSFAMGDPNSPIDEPELEVEGENLASHAVRETEGVRENGIFLDSGSGAEAVFINGDVIPECTAPVDPWDPSSPIGPCPARRVTLEGLQADGSVLFSAVTAGAGGHPDRPVDGLFVVTPHGVIKVVRRGDPIPRRNATFSFGGIGGSALMTHLGGDGRILLTESEGLYRAVPCPDPDMDGLCDGRDNCPRLANRDQSDTDENGIGNACQCGDVNGDGITNVTDALVIARGETSGVEPSFDKCDVDGDGVCSIADALAIARGEVGSQPEQQLCRAYAAGPPP